jgi:predicted metallo-beta-lactamase superfamily hydrolase
MNNIVNEISLFFLNNYPYPDELSKTRLTKMVYLADWECALKHKKQITNISWYFDHYGPYVPDVYEEAMKDERIIFENTFSAYGSPKTIIKKTDAYSADESIKLSHEEVSILNKVIEDTKFQNWTEFIDYIYNTEPILTSKKYSHLDLVDIAIKQYPN